eukprot:6205691-Pleurochrysis_carterae.AAC.1
MSVAAAFQPDVAIAVDWSGAAAWRSVRQGALAARSFFLLKPKGRAQAFTLSSRFASTKGSHKHV